MKKAFLAMAILGATVASAADSYLYWMVSESAPSYSYARVRDLADSSESGYLTLYNSEYTSQGTSANVATIEEARDWGDSMLAGLLSTDLTKSYIVELYNSDNKFVAQSAAITGSALADYISTGSMSPAIGGAWAASSFAIPEPSSGLLMLVGCAVLGLRRRKQKNA